MDEKYINEIIRRAINAAKRSLQEGKHVSIQWIAPTSGTQDPYGKFIMVIGNVDIPE